MVVLFRFRPFFRHKDAYRNFFVRRRLGLKAGPPRFKMYGRYKSIMYPQSGFKVEGRKLLLSKIGAINIKLYRPIKGDVKTVTLKWMPSGKWFATFSCKIASEPKKKPNSAVGIDVGLRHFAVLSDGQIVESPRCLRKAEEKLLDSKDAFPGRRGEAETERKLG